MRQSIDIALTFDDPFWAPAYATMRSVCIKSGRPADIVFHLFYSGLTPDHRQSLDGIGTEFGARLIDYDLDRTDILSTRIAMLPTPHGRLSPVVYARLFIVECVPQDVERLLFLDCDLYVRVPVERLYGIDLKGKAMAAVADHNGIESQTRRDLKPKRFFKTADTYFNAGVILFDAEKCRAIDFVREVKAILTEDELAGIYFDQDILNIVMAGRWLELETTWNFQNPLPSHVSLDPAIVHYTGKSKPWRVWARVPYKRTYRHLMTNDLYYRYLRERIKMRLFGRG